ncbi:MAG: MFS transporter [Gammaproteobacteria bacterium]|nr:MFS transporter [Gammaproteobacteria bacterium]MDH5736233.1 MFS transporter [Gammaproteobacteria bacterium]
MKIIRDKQVWGWAFYDWANSVFATVVIAGFFPVVFKQYWASELTTEQSTFWLGSANSIASLMIVVLAPLLGALADCAGIRKRLLLLFMLLGVVATMMFYTVPAGLWWLVLIAYVTGMLGFMGANVFYDALIVDVSRNQHIDKISGLGYGFGYLGGGILLALCVFMTEQPALFGFTQVMDVVLFSFVLTAIWWFVFSMPLAFWVTESRPVIVSKVSVSRVFSETARTFRHVLADKQIRIFLLAYWIYIDGVDTIIRMAVDYGLALGFDSGDLIIALLITQFVGFPAAILYSHIGDRIGTRRALFAGLIVYALITLWGYQMESVTEFYGLAIMIGLVQGGVQALSRSFYARMIPAERAAEYFGIYNMMGKAAAVLGPVLMGLIAVLTDNHRYSILSILVLFVLGMLLLMKVKDPVKVA